MQKTMVLLILLYAAVTGGGCLNREAANDLDSATIQALKDEGSRVDADHVIDFFLYFPGAADANSAAESIGRLGFSVVVRPAATGSAWLCLATKSMVPSQENLASVRTQFDSIVQQFSGEYDGWETAIVE